MDWKYYILMVYLGIWIFLFVHSCRLCYTNKKLKKRCLELEKSQKMAINRHIFDNTSNVKTETVRVEIIFNEERFGRIDHIPRVISDFPEGTGERLRSMLIDELNNRNYIRYDVNYDPIEMQVKCVGEVRVSGFGLKEFDYEWMERNSI